MNNTFFELGNDLSRRLRMPLLNFTYWTHLILGVCFYGAIGFWVEVLRRYLLHTTSDNGNVLLAMHTTYSAIIGATAMQLILSHREETYVRSFAWLVSTVFVITAAVCVLAANNMTEWVSLTIGITGMCAAAMLWWVANAQDEGLKDVDPSTATGGPLRDDGSVPSSLGGEGEQQIETALGKVKL